MNFSELLYFPNKDTRYPFLFLLLLALLALGTAVYFYFTGETTTMPWQTIAEVQPVSMPADRFTVLLHDFDIRVKGFVLSERFQADYPQLNQLAAYLTLFFIGLSLIYFAALVSTFRQLPFFAGMLLFMLFLSSFNFDLLGIFKSTNQYILMGALVVFGGVAFTLQAFLTQVSFRARLLLFGALFTGLAIYLYLASPLPAFQTTMHLVHYSAPGATVATLLFIIWVAYENIHGLLWLNTQAQNPEKRFSLWQLALIGGLYLINLLLLYLRNSLIIRMDVVLLNPFLILLISTLVGLWGTKRREVHYSRFFRFDDGAGLLYLIFTVLGASTIAYAFATVNDSLIRAFTDIIVYTHLAFGALFFIYILLNFGRYIAQKLRVYRVVYDPKVIPFYTAYVLGFLLCLALTLRTNFITYRKAKASYFNYLGDYYWATEEDLLAERFYNEANVYDNNNVKATYNLAALYFEKSYLQSEINQLKEALKLHPNPKVYSRLANKYIDRENFFDQLFVLRAGLKIFPENPQLLNNQALVYAATALVDSAEYFFDLARQHAADPEIIRSNQLAFYLTTAQGPKAAELAKAMPKPKHIALQSNLLFLQGFGKTNYLPEPIELPVQPELTPERFALVYHAGMQGQWISDQVALPKINQYLAAEANVPYRFDLSLLKAITQSRLGQTLAARTTLENLAATEPDYSAYLLDMIGLKLMQQRLYGAAAAHFEQARVKGWPEAGLHRAYALAFLPDKQVDALLEANQVNAAANPDMTRLANNLQLLIQASPNQIISQASDSVKVQYLQLNQETQALDATEFLAVASTIKNPELKKIGQKELAAYYVSRGNFAGATQVLEALLPQLSPPDELLSAVNILQAEILLQTNQLSQLQTALPRLYLTGQDQPLKYYYKAILADKQNRNGVAAKLYARATQVLPYHEPTVLAAANFYATKQKQDNRAYEILLNSLTYNPHSAPIYKAYILKSVETGLGGFAETALTELSKLISPAEMNAFQQQYEQVLAGREAALGISN